LRWAAIAGLVLPLALALASVFAKSTGNAEAARSCIRILRGLLGLGVLLLVHLAAVGTYYEHRARNRDALVYRPPGKLIDIGGYRLHLSCEGTGGTTVVLEYGHQVSYFDWSRVQPEVAKFTRVCFYDRAGYGWSDPSARSRVPSVMADELHTLLHAAGEQPPFVLVAHSFGSYNAVMFAHQFPGEVSALCW
jgi:alpha/beta hydrolase fold